MSPGENRWVELTYSLAPQAKVPTPVEIVELRDGVPVNGYALVPKPMPLADAIKETLFQHATVFTRLAEAFGLAPAGEQAKLALELVKTGKTDPESYGKFLKEHVRVIARLTEDFMKKADAKDPFGATAAARLLVAAAPYPARAQPLHLTLLEKLDAAQTMRQKADGDLADVPQNVRWQKDLFGRLKGVQGSRDVVEKSTAFLAGFEYRKIGVEAFPPLVESLMKAFQEAAAKDATGRATRALDALGKAKSMLALQSAHRAFLLSLEASSPR